VSDEPIARYLAELDRRLRGRPNRRRLVEEAADHLRESQAALRATGMGEDEAAREAVRRLGPAGEVAAAGGGRTAAALVLVLGVVAAVALVVAAAAKNPPFRDAPQPALPLHLFFGGLGVGAIAICAAWTVWAWSDPRATRGVVVRGAMATVGMTAVVALGELAIREGKERLYTMYCVRDGEPPHKLFCNPQGTRDFKTAELHALVCLVLAAAVLGLTLYAMRRHARRERRVLGLDVAAR
jgi:hypothetical protein